jgi:hypothetical protein
MTKKMIKKYERFDFDGLTVEKAIKELQDMVDRELGLAVLCIASYENDIDASYTFRQLETDQEYARRTATEKALKTRQEESDRQLLKELKAKYEQ